MRSRTIFVSCKFSCRISGLICSRQRPCHHIALQPKRGLSCFRTRGWQGCYLVFLSQQTGCSEGSNVFFRDMETNSVAMKLTGHFKQVQSLRYVFYILQSIFFTFSRLEFSFFIPHAIFLMLLDLYPWRKSRN